MSNPFTRELPLFPLPVVLFPGALLPLHIFEERYKLMIKHCMDSDKLFGVTYLGEKESWPPQLNRIGSIAQIMVVVPLEEGRMNILTVGGKRYRPVRYIDKEPYLRAEVELFGDDPEDSDASSLMQEVKQLYERAATAIKEVNEEQTPITDLPDNPEEFSFVIASTLQIELEKKLTLLELRSTAMRLKKIRQFLKNVVDGYELRAEIHNRAKRNGHSSSHPLNILKEE